VRRDLVTLRGEFWYQQLHLLPWAADLVAHDRRTLEVYLRHFYDHWCATPGALREGEFAHVVDVYARPGAFEQSIAWYRARLRERQAQATADPAALSIAQPATVLWSDSDPVAPLEWAEGIEAWFGDVSVVPVGGCGHFLPWERPAPLVRAVLEAAAR
jgi:pimeloyl-ACP methyl ester carboxylesterase